MPNLAMMNISQTCRNTLPWHTLNKPVQSAQSVM